MTTDTATISAEDHIRADRLKKPIADVLKNYSEITRKTGDRFYRPSAKGIIELAWKRRLKSLLHVWFETADEREKGA